MRSSSFIQDKAHGTKSQRFQPIKPELIQSVLTPHGFNLATLKTGVAVLADRADFQTTIARYRSQSEMKINGHNLDIVAKVPHLYGAVELFLGTYRQVCSNGMVVGLKFNSFKIKHLGSPVEQIEHALPILVAQEQQLVETIKAMQGVTLSSGDLEHFAYGAALLRLDGIKNVYNLKSRALLAPRRDDDRSPDLYTTLNVIQENLIRGSLEYSIHSVDKDGMPTIRNQTARMIGDRSVKSVEFNSKLWDLATSFIKAA